CYIDNDAHPSALLRGGKFHWVSGFKNPDLGLGMKRVRVIFHIGCVKMHCYRGLDSTPVAA
ncbi:MAG: hypothetical protein WAW75_05430, partial [Gallionella sp.]